MKTSVRMTAAFLFLLTSAGMTQPGHAGKTGHSPDSAGPGHHQPPPVRHLTEALSLSEEQVAAVQSIFESRRDVITAQRESRHQEHCDMKAGIDAEIEDVLTDEQRVLWLNLKTEGPAHRSLARGGKHRQRGNRPFRRCNDSRTDTHS